MHYLFIFLRSVFLLSVFNAVWLSSTAHAVVEDDDRYWFNVTAEGQLIPEKLRWYMEVQPRLKDGNEFDQLLVRPALNLALSKQLSLWLGYAYIDTKNGRDHIYEDRVWQQLLYNATNSSGVTLTSRIRLEQRFRDDGDKTGHRLRQMLRVSKLLSSYLSMSLIAWDEYHLNLNNTDWGAERGYDRNRLFLGIGLKVHQQARLEVGYLNQHINAKSDNEDQMQHILSTSLFLNF